MDHFYSQDKMKNLEGKNDKVLATTIVRAHFSKDNAHFQQPNE